MNIKRIPLDTDTVAIQTRAAKQIKLDSRLLPVETKHLFKLSPHCHSCRLPIENDGHLFNLMKRLLATDVSLNTNSLLDWRVDLVACKHVVDLNQSHAKEPFQHESGHCLKCELTDNLWMCLECGCLGCGRQQYGQGPETGLGYGCFLYYYYH